MSRLRAAALAALPALPALLAVQPAHAWCRTTTDSTPPSDPTACVTTGTPLYWSRRCQTFSLDHRSGSGFTLEAFRGVVTRSFDTWNAVDCGAGPAISITESSRTATCRIAEYSSTDGNANIIAFSDEFDRFMYPSDAIAVTVVWHNTETGEIYDADMLLNLVYAPFAECPDTGCLATTRFDLQNVVTHEAGHFLGLAHAADGNATMYYRADPSETAKRTLEADDTAGLCAAYGANTVPAECSPTPRHGFDPNCESEGDGCGCAVAGTPAREPPRGLLAGLGALLAAAVWRARRVSPAAPAP